MATSERQGSTMTMTNINNSSATDMSQQQTSHDHDTGNLKSSEMTMTNEQQTIETTNHKQLIDDNAQLIERNVKQIHIREESTIKKVLKTREIKHFDSSGQLIDGQDQQPSNAQQSFNGQTISDNDQEYQHQNQPVPSSQSNNQLYNIDQSLHDQMQINTGNHININNDRHGGDTMDSGSNPRNNINDNYQNLFIQNNNSANFSTPISAQIGSQPMINQDNSIQPIQRTSIKTHPIVPLSGYEELDSTLGYNNQSNPMRNMINDANNSIYGNKSSIVVQPMATNSTIIVQPPENSNLMQDNMTYMSHKSNYDIAYGTNVPMSQVPISTNYTNEPKIYDTQIMQQPIYAVNRDGTLTYVSQQQQQQPQQAIQTTSDGVRWRDPELEEVIDFLRSPDPTVRANSVAYLQHLTYADDHIKQRTRLLGGIPLLIDLLNRDILEVQRNVCGALRNLSYGRKNDDNKRAIRDAQGIQALVRTLVNNPDNEIREVATSVLWNLSSSEDIKWSIVDIVLVPLVSVILVPYTAWFKANLNSSQQILPTATETHWSTVFRNATGVLRNISSAGAHARKQLRDCEGLVESLFFIIHTSISRNDVENKLVENCVCILRNLSYRCQETQDPHYDKHYYSQNTSRTDSLSNSAHNSPSSHSSSANLTTSLVDQVTSKVGNNIGCFSFTKRSKSKSKSSFLSLRNNNHSNDVTNPLNENRSATLLPPHHPSNLQSGTSSTLVRTSTKLDGFNNSSTLPSSGPSGLATGNEQAQGKDLLWQPDVVKPYLALLSGCSNSETLEAAAGAIQNLAACFWQPSIEIRAAVRKERGLPVLVELLRMDRDRVVCVVATALRNLAIDQKNKELIGKYAMLDLVNKLTTEQADIESPSSDDTIAAVLATLHEVIPNNVDFVRSFYDVGGLTKLTYIVRNKAKFSSRVQRFAAQVLLDMWKFTELRDTYKKGGWKESHFIVRQGLNNKSLAYSVNSNTIERPMESQQADRSNSMKNLRTISDPIPHQNNMRQVNMNETIVNGLMESNQQNHHLDPNHRAMFNSVPMTYLTNQLDNINVSPHQQQQQPQQQPIYSRVVRRA